MSVYDLGDFEEALKEIEPAPRDVYQLRVEGFEETKTGEGRPMVVMSYRIVAPDKPEAHNKLVRDQFVMPWVNPDGQRITSGRFRVTQFVVACGKEMKGKFQFDPQAFVGTTFKAMVDLDEVQSREPDGSLRKTGEFRNVIRRYISPKKGAGGSSSPPPPPPKRK
jgi:hypothetical protein